MPPTCRTKTFDQLLTQARLKRIQAFGLTPDAVKELIFHTAQSTDIVAPTGMDMSNKSSQFNLTAPFAVSSATLMPVMYVVVGLVAAFGMDYKYRSNMTQLKKKLSEQFSQSVEEQQRQFEDLETKIASRLEAEENEKLHREWLKQQQDQKKNLNDAQSATA